MFKGLCLYLGLCSTISGTALVHDGDTLRLDGYAIRLEGVDAEELTEPNGYRAKAGLQSLIRGSVTCTVTGEKTYDRYVAVCFSNGVNLNAEMIRLGYALDCKRYSGGKYRSLEPLRIRERLIQKPYC